MKKPDRNLRVLLLMLGIAAGMVGLAFASVPLYRMFCQATGFGGTPQLRLGQKAPGAVGSDEFRIFFNADTSPNLPWTFKPEQRSVLVKAGESRLIAYSAKNMTQSPVTGSAVYNITPERAAQYFIKTQCFCFSKQTLTPGQDMDFPVAFYLDPDILKDPDVENLREITLSYTFYPSNKDGLPIQPSQSPLEQKPRTAY